MVETEQKKPSLVQRSVAFLEQSSGKKSFWPILGAFPSMDYLIPVLPNQVLMLSTSAALPEKWWKIATTFVFGSAIGACMTAWLVVTFGGIEALDYFTANLDSSMATTGISFIQDYGVFALAALAMLPVPPRTGVLVCAVSGIAPLAIGLSILVGRLVPAFGLSYLAAKAPSTLASIRQRFSRKHGQNQERRPGQC